jgi:hypothetical protein
LIGKYIEKFLSEDRSTRMEDSKSGVDMEMLIKQGFGN